MVMTVFFTGMLFISLFAAFLTHSTGCLTAAILSGAQSGVTLCISLAGPVCLWSGIGGLMSKLGVTEALSRLFFLVLSRLFPSSRTDPLLAGDLSANITANLLGLGNAATPMGVSAAKRLTPPGADTATDELCRLIVLNTASIQLLPTNVAAVRSALGAPSPFDILLPVWITSFCSAGLGVLAAWLLGKVRSHD